MSHHDYSNNDDLFREIELLRDHNRRMMISVNHRGERRVVVSSSSDMPPSSATPTSDSGLDFDSESEPVSAREEEEAEEPSLADAGAVDSHARPKDTQLDADIAALLDTVGKLLKSFSFLMSSPQLFVCDYYDSMINEIDIETEMLIDVAVSSVASDTEASESGLESSRAEPQARPPAKPNSADKVANLNKIRDCMINLIRKHEKDCLANCAKILRGEVEHAAVWSRGHGELAKLEAEFELLAHRRVNSDQVDLNNLKSDLIDFNVSLSEKLHAVKRVVFLNKSIFYVKNLNEVETKLLTFDEQVELDVFGRDKSFYLRNKKLDQMPIEMGNLITIENLFLNDVEIELVNVFLVRKIRKHFEGYNEDSFKPELYLFQDLLDCLERNGLRKETVLKRNYLVISEMINIFHKYIRKKIFNFDIRVINRKLQNIERLDLIRNVTVEDIEPEFFDSLTNLKKLYLNKCAMHTLQANRLSKLSNLRELNLKENELKNITEESFNGLARVKRLNLSLNKLESLGDRVFNELKELEELNLGLNSLVSMEINAFANLFKLKQLSLSGNQLEIIQRQQFSSLISLEELDLSFNRIKTLEKGAFDGLFNLKILNLSRNKLTRVANFQFNQLMNLEILELFENKLAAMESQAFYGLVKLKSLHLGYNLLVRLVSDQFYGLINLNALNLSWNKISQINLTSFDGLPSLKILNLSFNQLDRIKAKQFKTLGNLQILLLSRNRINSLCDTSFEGLTQLKKLYLVNNNLEKLHRSQFEKLKNLEKLDLSQNKFTITESNELGTLFARLGVYLGRS